MRYATLSNNQIRYAPRKIRIGDEWVFNPTDEMLLDAGYLPVIETEPPEPTEGYYYDPVYEEANGQIVQSWVAEEIEEPPMMEEDALVRYSNELTGADDPDLISAAETLIKQRMEES